MNREVAANTLTAVYYPEGVKGPELLQKIGAGGIVVAGGLHPEHNTKYFRVGHVRIIAPVRFGTDPLSDVLSLDER